MSYDNRHGALLAERPIYIRTPELYVRCSVDIIGSKRRVEGSVELGLSYSRGEPTEPLRNKLREVAEVAVRGASLDGEGPDRLSADLEWRIATLWGRPFFVEIWNESEALTQVYAPYGMPRDR